MRRWGECSEQYDLDGLLDHRRRRPSKKRVPPATVEQVLRLCRDGVYLFMHGFDADGKENSPRGNQRNVLVRLRLAWPVILRRWLAGPGHGECCCNTQSQIREVYLSGKLRIPDRSSDDASAHCRGFAAKRQLSR